MTTNYNKYIKQVLMNSHKHLHIMAIEPYLYNPRLRPVRRWFCLDNPDSDLGAGDYRWLISQRLTN